MRLLLLLLLFVTPVSAVNITGWAGTNRRETNIYLLDMTDGSDHSAQTNQFGYYGFYELEKFHIYYIYIQYDPEDCMTPTYYFLPVGEDDVTVNFYSCPSP